MSYTQIVNKMNNGNSVFVIAPSMAFYGKVAGDIWLLNMSLIN